MQGLIRIALVVFFSLCIHASFIHASLIYASGTSASWVATAQSEIAPVDTAQDGEVALITGRITSDADGRPLSAINVVLVDPESPDNRIVAATTDTLGVYTVTQAISATWKIHFISSLDPEIFFPEELPEYYNDVYSLEEAELITANVGTVTENINASLASIGQITGRVTSAASGEPVARVRVSYYLADDDIFEDGATSTDATGAYTLTTHAHGSYKLRFNPLDTTGYAQEFYNDKNVLSEATIVTVPEGRDLRNVDVSLAQGGKIEGFVTSNWRNLIIESPTVDVLNESGEQILQGYRGTDDFEVEPLSPPGTFTAANVPPGTYQLLFSAIRHGPILYSDVVTVSAGETVTIHAELPISAVVQSIGTSPSFSNTIILSFEHDPIPVLTTNGGQIWHFAPSTAWITDEKEFAYADRPASHHISTGISPRGDADDGIRFIAAVGDQSAFEFLHPGVYRSGDFGQSWAKAEIAPEIPNENCISRSALAPSLVDPSLLYVAFDSSPCGEDGLLVSDDSGVSWQNVTTIEGRTLLINHLAQVLPSPLIKNRVYVNGVDAGTWYVSDDAGVHWQEKQFPVDSLVLDAQNADYLYGWSERHGAPWTRVGRRSTDGGDNWQDWLQNPCPYSYRDQPPHLLAHPTQARVLFLRCDNDLTDGIYRTDDGGNNWQKLSDEKGQLLALDYGTPGRILWAKDDGLYASNDLGETWQALMAGYVVYTTTLYLPSITSGGD